MKSVKIAELKAKLSSYIKAASEGEDVIVYDRNLPVAKIVRFEKKPELNIAIPAKMSPAQALREAKALLQPFKGKTNLLEDLLAMREEERRRRG